MTVASDAATPQTDAELAARLRVSLARLHRVSRNAPGAAGLTPSQLSVLAAVEACPGMRIGDLAVNQAITAPSATRVVQGLVQRRLLDRKGDPQDKRACVIALTPDGHDALTAIRCETTSLIATRLGALSRADRTKLRLAITALERLGGADPSGPQS